ncbi:MAG: DNA-binding protein [Clostridiales bacterium]|nr:DNA-binding protein [Clostridiales bacterium]
MKYMKCANTYVVRLDVGDEIVASINAIAKAEGITLASVSGIGAVKNTVLGLLNVEEKKYYSREFKEAYELGSLTGNITTKDTKPYVHLHAVLGDPYNGKCHAGHLTSAVICAAGEIFITVVEGSVGREFNEELGLNVMDF